MAGLLFVVSAASGTGKTSLVKALLDRIGNLHISVSHTTRPQRVGEVDGVHYHFINKDEFSQQINEGRFIEYAEVFSNYYGTSHAKVQEQLNKGHDVLLEIDWQGAEQVRRLFPDSIQIFILPPSQFELRQRLSNRKTDALEVIEHRLSCAVADMQHYVNFDYVVVNDVFDKAVAELHAIITAHRLTINQQSAKHEALISGLLAGQV